jgi:outer membrane protein TolC
MNKIILIGLLLIVNYSLTMAQSVEELIEQAKEYNPGLKAMKLDYEASLLKANQVSDWPDPQVNFAIGLLPIETRLGSQKFRVGVSQMIPWKGALDAKSNIVKSMAEELAYNDDLKEIDIEYAIRSAYTMLQFLEAKKNNLYQRLEVLDALEELSKSAVRSGKGKLSNVLFIERKREVLEADLLLIEKKMEQPTIIINRWTNRSITEAITLSTEKENPILKSELSQSIEYDHPQFKILDNQILTANAKIKESKFGSKPKIGIGLDYAFIEERPDVNISDNGRNVLMPMGSISIPIHTGRFDKMRQEESIKKLSIEAKKEEVKDAFVAETELALSAIEYSDQVIKKFESLKAITKETLKLMRTEYASEGTRFEELLRLEMELIDYDLEILKAQYEKGLAMATLNKFK